MNSKTFKFVHEMYTVPEVIFNVIASIVPYFCYLWSYTIKIVSTAPIV